MLRPTVVACAGLALSSFLHVVASPTHAQDAVSAPDAVHEVREPELVTFTAGDGVEVTADLYAAAAATRAPIVLLFHQAASNAAEYAPIAARLVEWGWNALAVDSRSGGKMWGRNNRTVMRLGRSSDFLAAYADLEAAVEWARARGYTDPLVVWGSSYTSALVFRLAAEHPEVDAVMSFSPGEYLGPDEPVRGWAAKVNVPIFVTTATGHEVATARRILDASPSASKTQYEPQVGVHGSSTLRTDRNPTGAEENWAAVAKFLASLKR